MFTDRLTFGWTAWLLVAAALAMACPGPSPTGLSAKQRADLEQACSRCHALTPPEALPRGAWAKALEDMYAHSGLGDGTSIRVPLALAIADYEARAPEVLPVRKGAPVDEVASRSERSGLRPKDAPETPAIAHVAIVDVVGDGRPELLACDMRHGLVVYARVYTSEGLKVVASGLGHPAHVEVVDLDRDGRRDLLVCDLGDFNPGDHERGRVVLLRRTESAFETVVLASGLARPCDARALDADGDGDLDLIVAAFGWRRTGALILLENRGELCFARHVIDPRAGAVGLGVQDLDGDGRDDVVVLMAQQHEEVLGWRSKGDLTFEKRVLANAEFPAWGSNRLALADLDGDRDDDIILTNGDTLDDHMLKPYHGVRWLENQGGGRFARHEIASLYGVHGAAPCDLDGDGDIDLVACAFLPQHATYDQAMRDALRLPSVIWFEQTARGAFRARVLEADVPYHAAIAAGDLDGDGQADLAVGGFTMAITESDRLADWVTVWKGRGSKTVNDGR